MRGRVVAGAGHDQNAVLARADNAVTERFADLATTPASAEEATPQGLLATQEAEVAKWKDLIEAAGLQAN